MVTIRSHERTVNYILQWNRTLLNQKAYKKILLCNNSFYNLNDLKISRETEKY